MTMCSEGQVTGVQALPYHPATPRQIELTEEATQVVASLSELVSRVSRGDTVSFDALYDRLAPIVLGIALKVLRDRGQAEEIAQDVLLEVWSNAARFDPTRGSVMGWVSTITRNRSIDRVRSVTASRRRESLWALEVTEPDPVSCAVEARMRDQEIRGALSLLTELQRRSVEMAVYEGLTAREIADSLGVPLGTIKSRIRDGLLRLGGGCGLYASAGSSCAD
jgi:RNA polymerase sigma-70 factor, ECF subfamily